MQTNSFVAHFSAGLYITITPATWCDPWGLDSWILYDPNDTVEQAITKDKAETMKKDLERHYGTQAHLLEISSKNDLIDAWNTKVGTDKNGKEVKIDAVVVYAHGDSKGFGFKDPNNNANFLTDGSSFKYYDVGKLKAKPMSMFIAISCNSGKPNDNNMATEFLKSHSEIKQIVASDGSVYIGKETVGTFWQRSTRTTIYTDATQEPNARGFKLYQNDGKPDAANLGGIGHKFYGLDQLVEMAEKNA